MENCQFILSGLEGEEKILVLFHTFGRKRRDIFLPDTHLKKCARQIPDSKRIQSKRRATPAFTGLLTIFSFISTFERLIQGKSNQHIRDSRDLLNSTTRSGKRCHHFVRWFVIINNKTDLIQSLHLVISLGWFPQLFIYLIIIANNKIP